MVRTPVQLHPLSTVSMPGTLRTPAQVHPLSVVSMPSSAPAQHCVHDKAQVHPLTTLSMPGTHIVRTPAQARPLSAVCMPGTWSEHPLKCARSALYPCQAHGKNTRSSSLKTACQAHGKNTRSSAPALHCIHARHTVRTPVQVRPLSTVPMPGTR